MKGQPSFRIIDQKNKGEQSTAIRVERKEPEEEDQEDEDTWMFKTFKKEQAPKPVTQVTPTETPDVKTLEADPKPADLDPFDGVDDFMMSKRIEPTYQSHPQE